MQRTRRRMGEKSAKAAEVMTGLQIRRLRQIREAPSRFAKGALFRMTGFTEVSFAQVPVRNELPAVSKVGG